MVGVTSPPGSARDDALDYVKGCLVLLMVLYHWLNYFVGRDWGGYRYLRFLTPSFILISGFLVSRVYLEKYGYSSPTLQRRLVQRGLKLLVLFAVLNFADTAVAAGSLHLARIANAWPMARVDAVLARGQGGAAFSILLPIAYFLIVAPAVLALSKRLGIRLTLIAGGVLAVAIGMSVAGPGNAQFELLAIGLAGLAFGSAEPLRVDACVGRLWPLMVAYVVYLTAITVWNTPFPLQLGGVSLSVLLLYAIGRRQQPPGIVSRQVIALGKYSLFAYVVQIAALQLLHRNVSWGQLTEPSLAISLVIASLITWAAVWLAAAIRARAAAADRLYRAVFA